MKITCDLRATFMFPVGFFLSELTCRGKNKVVAREVSLKGAPEGFLIASWHYFCASISNSRPFPLPCLRPWQMGKGPAPELQSWRELSPVPAALVTPAVH